MLTVRLLKQDKLVECASKHMPYHALKWIDCFRPNATELQSIEKFTGISVRDLKRIEDDERPDVYEYAHFTCVYYKQAFRRKQAFKSNAMALLISQNLVVTLRFEDEQLFASLLDKKSDALQAAFGEGSSALFYQLLEHITRRYFLLIDEIGDRIDRIESEVFHNTKHTTSKHIFELKKGLLFYHKALSANREVLLKFENGDGEQIQNHQLKNVHYLYSDTVQMIDIVTTYREILVGAVDIYLSSVSNNLNKVMKRMTAMGSLILVPTLITGIYGMNFRFMPELTWRFGYAFAWGLIILSMGSLFWYFKKEDWF